MDYKRSDRLGEVLKEEISMILLREVKDPRIGFITITKVMLSGDLRHARVYFTMYGEGKEREDASEALQHAGGYIRSRLGKRLRLRYIPDLVFRYDDSIEYARHMESVFEGLKEKG